MKKFLILVSMLFPVFGLNLPEPGIPPPNAVDFETVKGLAQRKAQAEWPGCQAGTVVPYVDEQGQTVAYMFHFRTDGGDFPDYEQVVADILKEREGLTVNTDLTRWRSKYAHLLISARYDRTPIVCYGYGTSEYYAVAPEGLRRARAILGNDAFLSRIYFVAPVVFLEFSNLQGQQVIFSAHFEQSWRSRADFQRQVAELKAQAGVEEANPVAVDHYRQEWERALVRDFSRWNEVYIPGAERAPFYDWSYGCTPTSAAMVMGYIDRVLGYGRLVDWFWQRWDMVEGEWDKQIPNVQRECALRMFTDTTRGATTIGAIAQGLYLVAWDNDYPSFEIVEELGTSGNDWAWETIVREFDAGYPMVWSAIWAIHSLAGFGYRTPEKDLFVHNTWWQPAEWWHYSGNERSHVAAVHPAGADPQCLRLLYPLGDTFYNSFGRGETLQIGDTVRVRWDNSGNPGDWVAIDISFDAGRSWTRLDSVPDQGYYDWLISPDYQAQESVRLRLRQYYQGTLTAADGTFGCFRLVREPLAPKYLGPQNGLPVTQPPVVLVIDTLRTDFDSAHFVLWKGTADTVLNLTTTSRRCTIPEGLLVYNQTYKWVCRAHNRFGWGEFGPMWSFRVGFRPGIEEQAAASGFAAVFQHASIRLSRQGAVELSGGEYEVYNAVGKLVRRIDAGKAGAVWNLTDGNGAKLAAGMYFIRSGKTDRGAVQKLIILE
ncbi:MAG: hypothetical protein ABIK48_08040 [candidate division WOR-3 bacterium]